VIRPQSAPFARETAFSSTILTKVNSRSYALRDITGVASLATRSR
jgi:hypothetical protein